jgi:hypothetical protein
MKTFFSRIAVLALAAVGSLSAADISSQEFAVPFAFNVDNITLPAGHYRVEQTFGKPIVFVVNTETGHRIQIARENVNEGTGHAKLTFEKTENGYKLSKVF